jgi:aryl-alcohol dehydrogenase-like predicted oxidoreductase
MHTRNLGRQGLAVSAVGLGCMSMSAFYSDPGSDDESVEVIHRALDLGCSFLNTSDLYGPFTNEELIGRALSLRLNLGRMVRSLFHDQLGGLCGDGAQVGDEGA